MSTNVASLLGVRPVTYKAPRSSDTFVLPRCYIGVEIELEGDYGARAYHTVQGADTAHVEAKQDGSLRDCGIEMVFSEPLFGQQAVEAIDYMFSIKERYGLYGSYRTSTHVHVNYADEDDDIEILAKSIAIFMLIEKAAATTCGEHREYNTFCVPTYMLNAVQEGNMYHLTTLDNSSPVGVINAYIRNLRSAGRYSAVNVAALFKFGTLEYRLLGSATKEVTLNWINILLEIKYAAGRMSMDDILSHTSYMEFIRTVLPRTGDFLVYSPAAESMYTEVREKLLYYRDVVPHSSASSNDTSSDGDWPGGWTDTVFVGPSGEQPAPANVFDFN